MIRSLLLILAFTNASFIFAQFNDTIVYNSGKIKPVEITRFNELSVYYIYVKENGDTTESSTAIVYVDYFLSYDNEGVLQHDSRKDVPKVSSNYIYRDVNKYPDSVSVSRHMISVNPFGIALLALNLKHQYNFGKKMQLAILTRVTYISPVVGLLGNDSYYSVASGLKYTPFYNNRCSFGIDIAPALIFDLDENLSLMIPFSLDLDLFLNPSFGLSFDVGYGQQFFNGYSRVGVRGHFGLLWQLNNKKRFETRYYTPSS